MTRRRTRHNRRKTPRITRQTPPGSSPGTLHPHPEFAAPSLQLIQYDSDRFVEQTPSSMDQLCEQLDDSLIRWINVSGLGDVGQLTQLQARFGLHALALEDVINHHQRAKVEVYDDHLFIVIWVVMKAEPEDGHPVTFEQLSIFLGNNYVLTLQERPIDCLEPVRERLRNGYSRTRQFGADFLAYSLIDAVIDSYFPIVDEYGEVIEDLDEQISTGTPTHFMSRLHDLRGDLMNLRRAIRPLRDALVHLMPDPHSLFTAQTQFYLRDCYDHTVQLMDLLDTYREMGSDLREYYMSTVSNRMNEVMKVLTIIATIFIPLSFIAGVYGMNFNPRRPGNMPELNWPYGYVYAWLVMIAVASGLIYFIWRRGWLTGDPWSENHKPPPEE